LASSEQELIHLDSQLLLLIAALAPLLVAIPAGPDEPALELAPPINAFLEGWGGEEGAEDDEVARSLQGSHFDVCRNGRKDVGLKPREIDDEPDRDAADPVIPAAGPIPCVRTDSSPTARDGGGDLDVRHARVSSSE
jgi:hypothetical protein